MRRGVDARVPGCKRALARRRVGHAGVRVDAGDTRETPDVALIGRGRAWGCARGVVARRKALLFQRCPSQSRNICGTLFGFSRLRWHTLNIRNIRIAPIELAQGSSPAAPIQRRALFSTKKALASAFQLKNDGAPTPRRRAGGRLPRLDARVPLRREAPARQGHGRHARDRGARLRGPARGAHRVPRNVGNAESKARETHSL